MGEPGRNEQKQENLPVNSGQVFLRVFCSFCAFCVLFVFPDIDFFRTLLAGLQNLLRLAEVQAVQSIQSVCDGIEQGRVGLLVLVHYMSLV